MALEDKFNRVLQTKAELKEVLNEYGGNITDETVFREYPVIAQQLLESGGGGGGSGDLPTLFAPNLTINQSTTEVNISDISNGDFTNNYDLYLNDEYTAKIDEKTFFVRDYIIPTESARIKVNVVANANKFKSSLFSEPVTWVFVMASSGTIGLAYELLKNGKEYTCIGIGTATETDIEIGSELEELPVTEIAQNAFKDNTNITSVIIPDTVKNYGTDAFSGCTNLQTIQLSYNAISLPRGFLENCKNITEINIPDSITNIEDTTFKYCSGIKKVNITSLDAWCNIYMDDFSANYSNPLIYGELYLNGELVKEVTFPENSSSTNKFNGCKSLEKAILPQTAKSVGDYAFNNCSHLAEVYIPDTVTSIGEYAFYNCNSLKEIILPKNLKGIGDRCFELCRNLIELDIPSTVTSFGEYCFNGCSSLEKLNISDFNAWFNIYFDSYDPYANDDVHAQSNPLYIVHHLHVNGELLEELIIPTHITEIKQATFSGWYDLKTLRIPSNIQAIGRFAFGDCIYLENVIIEEGCTSIYARAFQGCTSLQSIKIPKSVVYMGQSVFDNTTPKEIKIEENVKYLKVEDNEYEWVLGGNGFTNGVASFKYGTKKINTNAFVRFYIKELNIPSSVEYIGRSAFYQCYDLTTVNFEEGILLKKLSEFIFGYCEKLVSISIPKSVETIERGVFWRCVNLKRVDFSNHEFIPVLVDTYAFDSTNANLQIKVPANLYDEWKIATNWSTLANKIVTEFTNEV